MSSIKKITIHTDFLPKYRFDKRAVRDITPTFIEKFKSEMRKAYSRKLENNRRKV